MLAYSNKSTYIVKSSNQQTPVSSFSHTLGKYSKGDLKFYEGKQQWWSHLCPRLAATEVIEVVNGKMKKQNSFVYENPPLYHGRLGVEILRFDCMGKKFVRFLSKYWQCHMHTRMPMGTLYTFDQTNRTPAIIFIFFSARKKNTFFVCGLVAIYHQKEW